MHCLASMRQLICCMRLLAVADTRLCDWNRRDLGDYVEMGLRLLDGMDEGAARAAVEIYLDKLADLVFDQLLRALPEGLKARARHGIVAKLEQLGLRCQRNGRTAESSLKATASSGRPCARMLRQRGPVRAWA